MSRVLEMAEQVRKIGDILATQVGGNARNGHVIRQFVEAAVEEISSLQKSEGGGGLKGLDAMPEDTLCFFRDGDRWCCVRKDFVNLQESNAGFGKTLGDAMEDYAYNKITSSTIDNDESGEFE